MKRTLVTGMVAALLSAGVMATPAFADPAFGPGNSGGGQGNSGPIGAKCHPPGQTATVPGCK